VESGLEAKAPHDRSFIGCDEVGGLLGVRMVALLVVVAVAEFSHTFGRSINLSAQDTHTVELISGNQHLSNDLDEDTPTTNIDFGKVYLSKPQQWEQDGTSAPMFPNDARLRKLTYWSALFVDVTSKTTYPDDSREPETETFSQVPIGKIPIMLRSQYCQVCRPVLGAVVVRSRSPQLVVAEPSSVSVVQHGIPVHDDYTS
jgi:hypothetical protein